MCKGPWCIVVAAKYGSLPGGVDGGGGGGEGKKSQICFFIESRYGKNTGRCAVLFFLSWSLSPYCGQSSPLLSVREEGAQLLCHLRGVTGASRRCELREKIASNPGRCEAAGWRFNSRRAGESRAMAWREQCLGAKRQGNQCGDAITNAKGDTSWLRSWRGMSVPVVPCCGKAASHRGLGVVA